MADAPAKLASPVQTQSPGRLTTRAFRGSLDGPKHVLTREFGAMVEGWALAMTEPIDRIVVHANGQPIGTAEYGRSRTDVAQNNSDHPQALTSGFRFAWRHIPAAMPETLSLAIEIVTATETAFLPPATVRLYDTLAHAAAALDANHSGEWQAWLEVARFYQNAGDELQTDAVLRRALDRWPEVARVAIRYAEIACRRQHYSQARAALQHCLPKAAASDAKLIRARLARVDQEAQFDGAAIATPPEAAPSADTSDDMRVMASFESLGFNCEFGIAQRRFNVEPLGLLRFGYIPLHLLVRGLAERFEGVGAPQNTKLEPVWRTEYGVSDTRYNLRTHTEIHTTSGADFDQLFARQCQRMRFLARKLLEDLQAGERIFLFQRYERLSDDEILILADRLAAYNPANRLLCVRLADDAHPACSIEWLGTRVAVGYIGQFSSWQNVGQHVSPGAWLALCRAALTGFEGRLF